MMLDVTRGLFGRRLMLVDYEAAAQSYLEKLRPENHAESVSQGKQRAITLMSFSVLRASRSDVQVFNELLVQYPTPRRNRLGQVVPDNMVVVHSDRISATWSYDLPLQPVAPFWMIDYTSKSNRRKDYADNKRQFENELKVPYYLRFGTDTKKLTLFRHDGQKYMKVSASRQNRYCVQELEIELGLQDEWVRFWHCGELLMLPHELLSRLNELERKVTRLRAQIGEAKN